MFTGKRHLYVQQFRLDETAEMDVSGQRGRRKTAELHTKRRQTSWNLARGDKVIRAGHRLWRWRRGVRRRQGGGLTINRAFAPLSYSLTSTRYHTNLSGRKYKWPLDVHKFLEYTLYLRQDWYSGSSQTAVGCAQTCRRSGTAQHRRGGTKRAETWRGSVKWELASARRRRRGCSSGVVCEIEIAGSKFCKCRRTHTHSECPLGKTLGAKLKDFSYTPYGILFWHNKSVLRHGFWELGKKNWYGCSWQYEKSADRSWFFFRLSVKVKSCKKNKFVKFVKQASVFSILPWITTMPNLVSQLSKTGAKSRR